MLRSTFLAFTCAALLAAGASGEEAKTAQPGPWKFGAVTGLNLTQSSYSTNWAGGDKGSIVWVMHADLNADRQFSRRFNLSDLLQVAYGQTAKQVGDPAQPERIVWDQPEKTTDLILLESTGRFTLDTFVDPFLGLRFESQFSDQSDPRGKLSLNPMRLTETAGIARVIDRRQDHELISRFGFGLRQTFSRSFTGATGTGTARFSTNDGGIEWLTTAKQPLWEKKVIYSGRLLVYQPVFYSRSGALEEFDRLARARYPARAAVAGFWKAADVNCQNTFSAQITRFLSVDLYLQLVYDKYDAATNVDLSRPIETLVPAVDRGIRKAGQFKQTLALGLQYRLF